MGSLTIRRAREFGQGFTAGLGHGALAIIARVPGVFIAFTAGLTLERLHDTYHSPVAHILAAAGMIAGFELYRHGAQGLGAHEKGPEETPGPF